MDKKITTYIITVPHNSDRKEHILKEFSGMDEFDINLIEIDEYGIDTVGSYITLILEKEIRKDEKFIILCQDCHQFTGDYLKNKLLDRIAEAEDMGADMLLGGVSRFNNALKISDELFWVDEFSGLQFTVLFNKFFKPLLEAAFTENGLTYQKISNLTRNKFFIYPFISFQKGFGHTGISDLNNAGPKIEDLFNITSSNAQTLSDISAFYEIKDENPDIDNDPDAYENFAIPTYIINLPSRTDRLDHIKKEFAGKAEFDTTIVDACKHEIGAVGLWNSIRKIIESAVLNDDDVIIICEDDHQFTEHYSKKLLFENILHAHEQGAQILCGGIGGFGLCVPITKNRFWVDFFFSTQFIILYRSLFKDILNEPFDDKVTADGALSEITSNKMVFYPFISVQKDFGYSDVTVDNNKDNGLVNMLFENAGNRLKIIREIQDLYSTL